MTGSGTCSTVGTCPSENTRGVQQTADGSCAAKTLEQSQINISESLIKEIGNVDARLAIALINVRAIPVKFTVATVHLSQIVYTSDDVAKHLTQLPGSRYFKEIERRAADLLLNGVDSIVYNVSIGKNKDGSQTLVMTPSDASLRLPSLEVTLNPVATDKSNAMLNGFEASSWRIK